MAPRPLHDLPLPPHDLRPHPCHRLRCNCRHLRGVHSIHIGPPNGIKLLSISTLHSNTNGLQVVGSWMQSGQLSPPHQCPADPETGACTANCLLADLPPRYEEVLKLDDQALPSYQQAVGLSSQRKEQSKASSELRALTYINI